MTSTAAAADLSSVLAIHFRDFGFWFDVRYLYSHALAIYRRVGDLRGEVNALLGLGEVERLVGECDQAREYYVEALALAQHLGDRHAAWLHDRQVSKRLWFTYSATVTQCHAGNRTADFPIFKTRDNSSLNTAKVRDLHHRIDLNTNGT